MTRHPAPHDASPTKFDRFRVEKVTYEVEEQHYTRDVIRHPGSVVIVPLLPNERVCLIRNFRATVARSLVELPAGTLDPGEPPLVAAFRELEEETGFRASSMVPVTSFLAAPGILDERMHLFLASGLTANPPQRELYECIENLIVPWDEALCMVQDGAIEDGKTILGLLFTHQFLLGPGGRTIV